MRTVTTSTTAGHLPISLFRSFTFSPSGYCSIHIVGPARYDWIRRTTKGKLMDGGAVAITLIVVGILYFLPSFVAAGRERNGGVLVLNIFLGWTLIGWVVALAGAASLPHKENPASKVAPEYGPSGELVAPPKAVKCPFCAEEIKPEAIVCKHCGRDLPST